jgi:hypothetical protein
MLNEGIMVKSPMAPGSIVDIHGRLTKALVCGSFAVADMKAAYGDTLELSDARVGSEFAGRKWTVQQLSGSGVFDFEQMKLDGPQSQAVVYLLVRIKSPRALDNLLAEPNIPRLSFSFGCDDGCQVWLNNTRLANHERIGSYSPAMFKVDALPLKLGWNEMVVKVVQTSGEWKFAGRFDCTERKFLRSLEVALP